MKRPLHAICIIPFTEAFLCPEPDCRVVSNMPICPSCTVTTIPLHCFTERGELPAESADPSSSNPERTEEEASTFPALTVFEYPEATGSDFHLIAKTGAQSETADSCDLIQFPAIPTS